MVLLKKLQQKYVRVKGAMVQWDELQSQLLSLFGNASSIIIRLQVLNENNNYDALEVLLGIKETFLAKQIEALEMIFISMTDVLKEFHQIILSFNKIVRDADQLLRGLTPYQMQLHVGIQPSLQQCLDGLNTFHKMHRSEFLLKSSILSSLMLTYFKFSADDIATLRQLLVGQPNIPKDEVQAIFDIILPKVAVDDLTGRMSADEALRPACGRRRRAEETVVDYGSPPTEVHPSIATLRGRHRAEHPDLVSVLEAGSHLLMFRK